MSRGEQGLLLRNCLAGLIATAAMVGAAFTSAAANDQQKVIVVASTTSTQDSGLFGYILPMFQADTGIAVRVVAQGSGQALDTARRGDADVVFVHAKSAEEKFLREGFGVRRYPVMYNDFVLVGPRSDPAALRGSHDVLAAFAAIRRKHATFISRGDRSGTHLAELELWHLAGIDSPSGDGTWYEQVGQGMGAALNMASAADAYVLSDRATWLAFKNKSNLCVAVEGDEHLFNQYGVMLVNPKKHPTVKKVLGQRFIDWLVSPKGQRAIGSYKINGEQLFFPNADDPQA